MSLTIRRENLPVRCEICHQTDLFDPETGNCMRCVSATVGAPLLRQDEAAVNDTKPDVSEEYRVNQQKFTNWSCVALIPVMVYYLFILPNLENLPSGPLTILFSLLGQLLHTFLILIFSYRFSRCPNCKGSWAANRGLISRSKNCRHCGATLVR